MRHKRATLPAPKPKAKKPRPNIVGRDVKTGKFVSLEETVKRPKGTVVEKFTPKAKKKK